MARTIWKFDKLQVRDDIVIDSSCRVIKWLHAETYQDASPNNFSNIDHARTYGTGLLTVWAIVEPIDEIKRHTLYVRGTGHQLTGVETNYIGSILDGVFVWHVFGD